MQSLIMGMSLEALEQDLNALGWKANAKRHFAGSAKKAFAVFFATWLLWKIFSDDILAGLLLSAIACAASLWLFASSPSRALAQRAMRIEKHLPFALMQLSVELNAGAPFNAALKRLGQSYGEFSDELNMTALNRNCRQSVPEALLRLARRNRSGLLKRAVSQMVSVYEHGQGPSAGEPLKKLALEILSRQKTEAKEFSAKISTFSVAFVVLAAVVPAMFQAFILVGSSFMEMQFSPGEALGITTILFPCLNIAMLAAMNALTPEFMK